MAENKIKSNFKVGDKIWYISSGYIASGIVRAIFVHEGEVQVSTNNPKFEYNDGKSQYIVRNNEDTIHQDNAYKTKEALIKYIKEEVTDEE